MRCGRCTEKKGRVNKCSQERGIRHHKEDSFALVAADICSGKILIGCFLGTKELLGLH